MRTFKTRWFARWTTKEKLTDKVLSMAVEEITNGLIDANLGGYVLKKRVARPGSGKSGGVRTLVAFRANERVFFIYGFAKNERANIDEKELKALKLLARDLLSYSDQKIEIALVQGELIEV